jgi:hypothetical protein
MLGSQFSAILPLFCEKWRFSKKKPNSIMTIFFLQKQASSM